MTIGLLLVDHVDAIDTANGKKVKMRRPTMKVTQEKQSDWYITSPTSRSID
jgi:hypothetical protein